MAPLKIPLQVYCPSCKAGNRTGSPYCSRCGAPLSNVTATQSQSGEPISAKVPASPEPSPGVYNDGQDPSAARQAYDKASKLLMDGEEIKYVAVASKGGVGHAAECAVATNKRLIVFKKKMLGSSTQDDCSWRDIYKAEMKEGRNGLIFVLNAIQGWQLAVESLPQAQAWRLYDLAVEFSERLRETLKKQQPDDAPGAPSSGVSTVPTSLPQEQPYVAAPQPTQPMPSAPLATAQTLPASMPSTPLAAAMHPELQSRSQVQVQQSLPQAPAPTPAQLHYNTPPLTQHAVSSPLPQVTQQPRPLVSGPLSARMAQERQGAQGFSGPLSPLRNSQVAQNQASGPLGQQPVSGSLNGYASQQQVRSSEPLYAPPSQPLSQPLTQPQAQSQQPVQSDSPEVASQRGEAPIPLHESVLQEILRASRHEAAEAAARQSLAAAFQAPPQVAPQELVFQEYSAPPVAHEMQIGQRDNQSTPPSSPLPSQEFAPMPAPTDDAGQGVPFYPVEEDATVTGQLMTQILNPGESLDTDLLFQGERQTGQIMPSQQGQPSRSRNSRSKTQTGSTASSTSASKKAASADDPVKKMKQLKEMIDAGLINQEDYELKKSEILSRL
ncbi:MAG: PH domain-containing protein [Chloroflexi bacterium]|nr:PH domain-containing protein [Chloroflexota bacterium]